MSAAPPEPATERVTEILVFGEEHVYKAARSPGALPGFSFVVEESPSNAKRLLTREGYRFRVVVLDLHSDAMSSLIHGEGFGAWISTLLKSFPWALFALLGKIPQAFQKEADEINVGRPNLVFWHVGAVDRVLSGKSLVSGPIHCREQLGALLRLYHREAA